MKRSIRIVAAALLPVIALALLYGCGTKPPAVVDPPITEDPYWTYTTDDWDPWTIIDTEASETEPTTEEPTETEPPTAPVVNTTQRITTTTRRTTTTTRRTTTTTRLTTTTMRTTPKPTTTSPPFTTIPSGGSTTRGGSTASSTSTTSGSSTSSSSSTSTTTTTSAAPVKVTGVGFTGTTVFTLQAGRTQLLTWTVTPSTATNKGVVFSSSNNAVATVSPTGLVTGRGEGTATITITTTDNLADMNYTDTATVTVTPVYATSINIYAPASPAVVKVGETITLTARVNEGGTPPTTPGVNWSSGDDTKATISSSGVVRGVFPGVVVITATSKDGKATQTTSITVTAS